MFVECIQDAQKHFAYAHNIRYVMLCYVLNDKIKACCLTSRLWSTDIVAKTTDFVFSEEFVSLVR